MRYEKKFNRVKITHYKLYPKYKKYDILYYIIINIIYDAKKWQIVMTGGIEQINSQRWIWIWEKMGNGYPLCVQITGKTSLKKKVAIYWPIKNISLLEITKDDTQCRDDQDTQTLVSDGSSEVN